MRKSKKQIKKRIEYVKSEREIMIKELKKLIPGFN